MQTGLPKETSRYSPENSPAIFIRGGEPWLMGYCWSTSFKVLGVLFSGQFIRNTAKVTLCL